MIAFLLGTSASAQELKLSDLVDEALRNNQDIRASQARIEAAKYRIPQSKSLPDPMFMFGYQNEGFDRYTYGEMQGAQWMFSASQMFPFPGKRSLKGEMAARDAESLEAMHDLLKLRTAARVKELYFDLFLAHRNIDLLQDRRALFVRVEELTLARYAAGKAMQQEVLMAQTEKYMLLEKEEMFKQKIRSLEAMLHAAIGREKGPPLGRPVDPGYQPFLLDADEAFRLALIHSPEIKARDKMIEAAGAKVQDGPERIFSGLHGQRQLFQPDRGIQGHVERHDDDQYPSVLQNEAGTGGPGGGGIPQPGEAGTGGR